MSDLKFRRHSQSPGPRSPRSPRHAASGGKYANARNLLSQGKVSGNASAASSTVYEAIGATQRSSDYSGAPNTNTMESGGAASSTYTEMDLPSDAAAGASDSGYSELKVAGEGDTYDALGVKQAYGSGGGGGDGAAAAATAQPASSEYTLLQKDGDGAAPLDAASAAPSSDYSTIASMESHKDALVGAYNSISPVATNKAIDLGYEGVDV